VAKVTTSSKEEIMSKVLNDLAAKHPEKIDSIERDDTGWIINLTDQYVDMSDPLAPCHMIFEDTVAECVSAFRSVVKKPKVKK
jgi:hypothetical protein